MDLRQHLEEELKKDYQLLKEFEDRKRNETNPRLINQYNSDIERIEQQIIERQQKLNKLTQTSPNNEKSIIEDLGFGVKLEMIYIPGGTFTMGAPEKEEGSRDSERPRHQVTLQPFYMGKYTVTQEQWEKVAGFFPQVTRELDPHPSHFKGDKLPVEQVSWLDAVEFCARLSNRTGKKYRLPSEAEWEYACRAGSAKPFAFGDTITTDVVNYNGNATYGNAPKGEFRGKTTPVGTFKPNAFGLHDMHGNVWEWCADTWHNNYEGAPTDGSAWINENDNQYCLLRGGSWINIPSICRSAYRNYYVRDNRTFIFGFRVVCVVGRS
ncbi:SUMF1/EgtB/PvdO family nonheme iron enzyme [Anabaena cylindrica UHCC 0172]|uniref:SUMF1/EgtB/PvdO family nonheme iron enzyme n=1 Tax=Anabaena cylindrica TaxID=1165 RepID=UPI002B1F3BE1|nr:SUMF1/EgtB/PvdO family nonheme iron enzyme [Anabaena cylindrica]MEA5552937.1 SUMF1/EgtB/PvdO family nonheme iron enzyme [Anabaena cylindrica UHCC 0172]